MQYLGLAEKIKIKNSSGVAFSKHLRCPLPCGLCVDGWHSEPRFCVCAFSVYSARYLSDSGIFILCLLFAEYFCSALLCGASYPSPSPPPAGQIWSRPFSFSAFSSLRKLPNTSSPLSDDFGSVLCSVSLAHLTLLLPSVHPPFPVCCRIRTSDAQFLPPELSTSSLLVSL